MKKKNRLNIDKSFRESAAKVLLPLVKEFISKHNKVIGHPNRLEDLHRLRISGKRLRYVMEIYRPLYGKEYNKLIKAVEEVIEMMGLIHDCDVLVGEVRLFRDQIETYNRNIGKSENHLPVAPIKQLMIKNRSARRESFVNLSTALNEWKLAHPESKVLKMIGEKK